MNALKKGLQREPAFCCLSCFHAPEKMVTGFFHAPEDILKHLRMDVMVLWPDPFDFRKLGCLLVIADADFAYLSCVPAFL